MKTLQLIAIPIIIALAGGCSSSQRTQPLDLPVETIGQAAQEAVENPIFTPVEKVPDDWWRLFNDAQLNGFIETALERNPTLQTAQAKILAASYTADRLRAVLYPSLTWAADVSRQKLSKTGVIPFQSNPAGPPTQVPATPGSTGGIPVYFSLYETELQLAYEFDFWKKNRNTLRAALGQVQTNIAEEAFARLRLAIAVAQTYFELQTDYKREEVANALARNKTEYRDMVLKRIHANLDNDIALMSAESSLADAQRALLQIQGDIAVREDQLKAYLAGNFDEEIFNTHVIDQPLPQVPLPKDLPLHLISQRPDIIAQLWLIESAGRQIEVAKAGFYPDFNLTAFYGYQTIHFREWFKWPSSYFNVDPAVSLPIFDGGRLLANLRGSEINYDLAILQYNELVLQAAQETLDGIAVLRNAASQLQEYVHKLRFQTDAYELTSQRVTHNLNNILDKLTSEGNVLAARDQEIVGMGNTIQAILALIKALGGGYDICYEG